MSLLAEPAAPSADPITPAAPVAPDPVTPPASPDPITPAPAPITPKGFVSEDGKFVDGWLDRLSPELEPAKKTLAKYRDINGLGKSHFELQQLLGKKSTAVEIPGERSTPEEIAAFRKAIGAPEKAEDYKLKPEQLPEGVIWDENIGKGYSEIALRHNAPIALMQELAAFQLSTEQIRAQEFGKMAEQELETNRQSLKTEWGGNFETNLGLATRAAKTFGLDVKSPGLTDPAVVKALARAASMMSEDKLVSGDFSPTAHPGIARAKDIQTNPQNPLYAKYQAGDPDTVAAVRAMHENG